MIATASQPVLDTIPAPGELRRQLSRTLAEADLLRRLLRTSEQAQIYRKNLAAGAAKEPECLGQK